MLRQPSVVNAMLWTTSAGDQQASLFHARVHDSTRTVCWAGSGQVHALLIRSTGVTELPSAGTLLGANEEFSIEPCKVEQSLRLDCGDVLVIYTCNAGEAQSTFPLDATDQRIADILKGARSKSAQGLAELVVSSSVAQMSGEGADYALLVIRRR